MIRHTGGFSLGATSTRSRPDSRARARASSVGMMPSWAPSAEITRIGEIRICSLMRCCFSMASVSVALRDSGDAHATTGPFESRFETWPMTSGIGPHAHRPPGYRVHGQRMDVHYDRSAVAHTTAAPSPPFIKLKTRIKTQLWLRQTPVGGRLIAHSTKIIVIARKTLLPGSKAAGKQGCRKARLPGSKHMCPGTLISRAQPPRPREAPITGRNPEDTSAARQ